MGFRKIVIVSFFAILLFSGIVRSIQATEILNVTLEPQVCPLGTCPKDLKDIYDKKGEVCVDNYEDFKKSPGTSHFWVEDPETTTQGKADDRARQFIYWVMHNNAVDDHPAIKKIWDTSRTIAYAMVIVVAAVLGLGYIIGQKTQFNLGIKIAPSIMKIALALLYITFSAAVIFLLIQLSEILMRFFIENLGGKDLFNIYFSSVSQEKNYLEFVGCRDLNIRVQEAAGSELLLLKLTNFTYYAMGIMVLLRKIVLWFLLFIAPFLAILFPFVFIRNIGWIWIGVFFQWLFYGPIFSLFLGGLATLWKAGIPFAFDFSRTDTVSGYIYPTAINILYGGPAQKLTALNNGNYIDTFVEYVITLIMLWAVILLPWLLLRIFRDYCCDGIYAMKNILLAMYDQTHNNPKSPPSSPVILTPSIKMKAVEIPVQIKLETVEQIKKTSTEEIKKSMDISATKLTDVARYETNKQTRENVNRNITLLSNPMKADTPTDRQKYMNIRTELFNRAVKQDVNARQIISSLSQSPMEKMVVKQNILKTTPAPVSVSTVIARQTNNTPQKVASVNTSLVQTVLSNPANLTQIATGAKVDQQTVTAILHAFLFHLNEPANKIVNLIKTETHASEQMITTVLRGALDVEKTIAKEVMVKEGVKEEEIQKVIDAQMPIFQEGKSGIENTVAIPPYISIQEYEEVKNMWSKQYETGEVPVTENITSRLQWVDQDTVFITNTLDKLLSTDEILRQQGLDDVGYILPIFMINNLKGEQLLVYLKAKLEAAKTVQHQLDREKELTNTLKSKSEEELVDVSAQNKKEEKKEMHLQDALTIDGEEKSSPNSP